MIQAMEDSVVIYYYLKFNNTRQTSEMFGCSEETIRRILIKNQIPRTGYARKRKSKRVKHRNTSTRGATKEELKKIVAEYYSSDLDIVQLSKKHHRTPKTISEAVHKYGKGLKYCERNSKKISNEELFAEISQGKNCYQIAREYNITPENVYRRARKMGIAVSNMGGGGHWYARCKHYGRCDSFDESITLNAVITKYDGICQICGQKVDKLDIKDGHIRKRYPTVDHIIPLSKGGSHTWDNVQLAHMGCNAGKCDSTDYTVKAKGV